MQSFNYKVGWNETRAWQKKTNRYIKKPCYRDLSKRHSSSRHAHRYILLKYV